MVISAIIFYLEGYGNLALGKYIYKCVEGPTKIASYPCYAAVDMSIIMFMAGIFMISLLTAVIKIFLFWRSNKKS